MDSKKYKIYSDESHKTMETIKNGKLCRASVKGIMVQKESSTEKTSDSTGKKQGRK